MLDINSYNFGDLKEFQVTFNIPVVIKYFLFVLEWGGGGEVMFTSIKYIYNHIHKY